MIGYRELGAIEKAAAEMFETAETEEHVCELEQEMYEEINLVAAARITQSLRKRSALGLKGALVCVELVGIRVRQALAGRPRRLRFLRIGTIMAMVYQLLASCDRRWFRTRRYAASLSMPLF